MSSVAEAALTKRHRYQDGKTGEPTPLSHYQGRDNNRNTDSDASKRSRSKVIHQIAHADAEGLSDTQQSMKTNPLLTALDLADVNRVQIGLFGQFFLAHAGSVAVFSDGFSKDSEMWFGPRHGCSEKHEGEQANTPNMGLFEHCAHPNRIQGIDPQNGEARFRYHFIYQLEFRDDVATGSWSPATGEISATKTNIAVSLPMRAALAFIVWVEYNKPFEITVRQTVRACYIGLLAALWPAVERTRFVHIPHRRKKSESGGYF